MPQVWFENWNRLKSEAATADPATSAIAYGVQREGCICPVEEHARQVPDRLAVLGAALTAVVKPSSCPQRFPKHWTLCSVHFLYPSLNTEIGYLPEILLFLMSQHD